MAALQGIVLLVAAAGILPFAATLAAVVLALGSLVWSFGRDIGWLWRNREGRTTPRETSEPTGAEAYASVSTPRPVLATSGKAGGSSRL